MTSAKRTIIISLGGSLIVPEEIDTEFLKEFRDYILSQTDSCSFIIISGGGRTCRKYLAAAQESSLQYSDIGGDYLGIAAINLNAELLKIVFGESAWKKVFQDLTLPEVREKISHNSIVIGGALNPGHSSDMNAVLAAENVGAKEIINLSNIDYVYSADPKIDSAAVKLERVSWTDYRKIIPPTWTEPGLNTPFDPVASKKAHEEGMKVIVMNGKPLSNLKNYLAGEKFEGTVIS